MADTFKIKALIDLLDDPDTEIYNIVSNTLVSQGFGAVPELERVCELSNNKIVQNRIESIIQLIQFNQTIELTNSWLNSEKHDLLEGIFLVSKTVYHNLEFKNIEGKINNIRWKLWIELNDNQTALEKIKTINRVFFDELHFAGANPITLDSHFINNVIESKLGSPILITLMYSIIAQQLELPIFPVNLPQNLILSYQNSFHPDNTDPRSILFYINPYKRGSIFSKNEIDLFLEKEKIEPKNSYYLPCSNTTSIGQLAISTALYMKKEGLTQQSNNLKKIFNLIVRSQ